MNSKRLALYQRLRDFKIPSAVLDAIFEKDEDLKILENAFDALVKDGFKEDEAAEDISKMIFNELDIEPNQSFSTEK